MSEQPIHMDIRTEEYSIILTWTVENLAKFLSDKINQTWHHENSLQPGYSLHISFPPNRTSHFLVYFKSPSCNSLRNTLKIECEKEQYTKAASPLSKRQLFVIASYGNSFTVQPDEWQHFVSIDKQAIAKELLNSYNSKLIFEITLNIQKYPKIPQASLTDDFENLLNNTLYSDVTMKSTDGIEYKVHKVVLASRSPVLKAHFDHNTIECDTNVIESPIEADILQEVLTFIYCEKAPRVDEIPEKLLAAADYYQLNRLKSLCEESLSKKLSIANAIEILQIADLHSADTLKLFTLNFIKERRGHKITETDGWSKLKSVKLIKCICEYVLDNKFG